MKKLLIVLLILAAGVWFGVPAFVQTDWAKERVQKSIEDHTHRRATVGSISFGWLSGLEVKDVELAQREGHPTDAGPLFRLESLKIDVSLKKLMSRELEFEELTAVAPKITLIRFPDGTFNVSDLMEGPTSSGPRGTPEGTPPAGQPSEGTKAPETPKDAKLTARFLIKDAELTYVDQKLGTRFSATDLDAETDYRSGNVTLNATCKLNGGETRLRAKADLSKALAPFTLSELTIDGSSLHADMANLGLFFPLMGSRAERATGKLRFRLRDVEGTGFDMPSLQKSLKGSGDFAIEGGALASGPIIQILSLLQSLGGGDASALAHAGSAQKKLDMSLASGSFRIDAGRIHTSDLAVKSDDMSLALKGSTSLQGELAYALEIGAIDQLLAKNAQLKQVLGPNAKLPLRLGGTLAAPSVSVDPESALKNSLAPFLQGKLTKALEGKVPAPLGDALKGLGLGGNKK